MDAREKLRQYLEQRREMGESELVLDTMTVDEALRIVGAKTVAAKPMATVGGSTASVPRAAAPDTSDWRTALRETGAAPGAGSTPPRHPDATLSAAKGSGGPAFASRRSHGQEQVLRPRFARPSG